MHSMGKTMLDGHYISTDQSCRPDEWTRIVVVIRANWRM